MAAKVLTVPSKIEWDDHGEFCSIPLSVHGKLRGVYSAKIDPDAFEDLSRFNWHLWAPTSHNWTPYARRLVSSVLTPDGTKKRCFECMHGRVMGRPGSVLIDHINGDGLDNRLDNLREADISENARNRSKTTNPTTSRFKGVWRSRYRWRGAIKVNGKLVSLGSFKRRIVDGIDQGEIDAAVAYDQAACKYFGCFARLNFPEERNVVSLGGTRYKMIYLPSGPEKTVMEKKIQNLREMKVLEIFEILGDKTLAEIEELCHYLSCGVDQLAARIKMHDPGNPESVISLELQQRAQRALQKET